MLIYISEEDARWLVAYEESTRSAELKPLKKIAGAIKVQL